VPPGDEESAKTVASQLSFRAEGCLTLKARPEEGWTADNNGNCTLLPLVWGHPSACKRPYCALLYIPSTVTGSSKGAVISRGTTSGPGIDMW
jgi:hypothetical protein